MIQLQCWYLQLTDAIYLDTCVWCRPFDEENERILRETNALLSILKKVDEGAIEIIGSSVLLAEVSLISSKEKREALEGIMYTQSLTDLNTLPFPAWDLLPVEKYRAHNWHCFGHIDKRTPYGIVYSSFGCPNNCTFCVIHTMFNKSRVVRFRDPQLFAEDVFWWG